MPVSRSEGIPLALGALICLALGPQQVRTRIIDVPDDFAQIGTALAVAFAYDTVLVAPGVYEENIVWPLMQGITLLSTHGPEVTIVDGGAEDQVLGIYTGVDTTTVIRGLTLRNGHAAGT